MNRRRLAVVLTLLALASLACNFLVPLPASPLPPVTLPAGTAGAALSAVPATAAVPATPLGAATTAEVVSTPVSTSVASAPNVIGYAPVAGEVLLPGGAIDVYFDQAMEPQSVEAAFATTPSLLGRFSWPDAQTLTET